MKKQLLAITLMTLAALGFNQVQVSAYQSNLENQNKTIKSDYSVCQRKVEQVKGVIEKW